MGSELGRKMLDLANQQVETALLDLADVDASDTKAVMALQMKARFGREFAQWLLNMAHEGEQAMQVFQQQRQEG